MVSRGDIYYIDLPIIGDDPQGAELVGPHWHVVVSKNAIHEKLKIAILVPLTSLTNKDTGLEKDAGSFRLFRIRVHPAHITWEKDAKNKFDKTGLAKTEQVRYMSIDRLGLKCGTLNDAGIAGINAGLADVLSIPVPQRRSPPSGPISPPLRFRD